VDAFFEYNDSYFLKWKLLKLLLSLQLLKPDTIIYANYSRKGQVDWIVKNIIAKNKIGVDGDTVNQPERLKIKGNTYYTQLIEMAPGAIHEFERNRRFFEIITGQNCDYYKPFIDKRQLNITPNNSIVVFIGASDKKRRWANRNFSDLSKRVISGRHINVILTGGKDETPDSVEIQQYIATDNIINKTGKLSLVQLCELIGSAKLVICSDTVAIHVAAALSIPAVCISRGDLYKRFVPYPDHIENKITTILPPDFEVNDDSYNNWSLLDINSVTLDAVYNAVDITLKQYYPTLDVSS
jgi:ADP-heptose:LPS heptosyltransferase